MAKCISVSLELKINVKMTFNKFKHLLLKTGTNFWIDYCKFKDDLHYILTYRKNEKFEVPDKF